MPHRNCPDLPKRRAGSDARGEHTEQVVDERECRTNDHDLSERAPGVTGSDPWRRNVENQPPAECGDDEVGSIEEDAIPRHFTPEVSEFEGAERRDQADSQRVGDGCVEQRCEQRGGVEVSPNATRQLDAAIRRDQRYDNPKHDRAKIKVGRRRDEKSGKDECGAANDDNEHDLLVGSYTLSLHGGEYGGESDKLRG